MTGDREWPTYDAGGGQSPWGQEPSVSPGTPILPVPYGGPHAAPPPPPRGGGKRLLGLLVGLLALAVLGVVGIVAVIVTSADDPSGDRDTAVDGTGDGTGDGTDPGDRLPDVPSPVTPDVVVDPPIPPSDGPTEGGTDAPPPVLSVEGFEAFVDAVAARGTGTQVFSAVLYPEYAVVDVPLEKSSASEQGLRWDGADFAEFGPPDSAMTERVDLALVDGELLVGLVARAKKLVDDPTTWYVIIEGASTVFSDDGTRIRAYASNLSETAYLATRLDGTLVRRYVG